MPEAEFNELADPAEEILVHVEPAFVQRADHPAIDEPPSDIE